MLRFSIGAAARLLKSSASRIFTIIQPYYLQKVSPPDTAPAGEQAFGELTHTWVSF
jgi:hypothetical protein